MPDHRCPLDRLVALLASLVALAAMPPRVRAQPPPAPHHPGRWTTAAPWPGRTTFENSVHAVHMALLRGDTLFARPHSQVLAWGNWSPGASDGGLWAWDPATDAAADAGSNLSPLAVSPPPYDLFCAGHSSVPDASGDLLVVGGTERGHTGEALSARFRALERDWLVAPMVLRRWYANATPLADGRVLATAGWAYDHMVVFGGRRPADGALVSDVQRYAITDAGHWDPALTGSGAAWPEPRESHTLADRQEGPCYLFGGRGAAGALLDVWQLVPHDNDLEESHRWQELSPRDPPPELARWRHAAVVAAPGRSEPFRPNAAMYVHGGLRNDGATLGDLWKLEWVPGATGHWAWFELTDSVTGDVPGARSGHGAVWDREHQRMILYGGESADGTVDDPSVHVLRFPNGVPTWSVAVPRDPASVPAARTRHAMAVDLTAATATGVVFGGRLAGGVLSDELWEFTLTPGAGPDTVTWTLRPPGGAAPAPRAGATAIVYEMHPRSYVVLGGELEHGGGDSTVWEYRRDTNAWSRHPALPRALTGATAFREHRPLTALQPEVYDPVTNAWSLHGEPKKLQSYHMIFLASDGKLYSPGPNRGGRDSTWRFDPATGGWSPYATNDARPLDDTIGGILYRPDRFMKCGGFGGFAGGATWSLPAGPAGPPSPAWRPSVNAMALSRSDHILSMLPTGHVIATGGQGRRDNDNADPEDDLPRKRPEIWDPDHTETGAPGMVGRWHGAGTGDTLAAEPVTRGHHSSAVILPDGRILSGGGWDRHPVTVRKSVDQYSPPYLFRPGGSAAARPRLQGAQDRITWGREFQVACPDPVVAACLIRPGATTHAFNQDCRYVPLEVVSQPAGGHQVTLRSPPDANHAPPGNYLLFVLRDDDGRRVPSVARWVNVGGVQTGHATWDTIPPAAIGDLQVTAVTATSHTLQWTAPADAGEGSSGRATRYELRYRSGGRMPTLEDFFTHGTSVVGLPAPQSPGTVQSFTVNHPETGRRHYFRIISRDGAGSDRNWSDLSNQAEAPRSGRAFVDALTAAGWELENSILDGSPGGEPAPDGFRLRHPPALPEARVRLRVRGNENESATLDEVRLVAVDHAPGVRAWPVGGEVILGTRVPALRVTTSAGVDVTPLLDGTGAGFAGGPGDTLLVELAAAEPAAVAGDHATGAHDPFILEDAPNCPPDCGETPGGSADPAAAAAASGRVEAGSGIHLQAPDGPGGWRTVVTRHPRELADEAVFDGLGHAPVRLVFEGRHTVRFVGRVQRSAAAPGARKLPLLAARHSRSGDVAAAVDSVGGPSCELAARDTVSLEFGWPPLPEGQERELLLLTHGAYLTGPPGPGTRPLPERFVMRPMRPNPFTGVTTLQLELPAPIQVRLEVLDAQGRRVRVLARRELAAGSHAIEWDGRNEAGGRVGPGVYFYRLQAGDIRRHGRVTRVP